MKTYCAIKRILSILLVCFLVSTNIIAVEVNIDGLKYDLKGTRATVLCIVNTQASIVVPETVDYNGYTYVVDSLADFCFSNIRVHSNYNNEADWYYDWALNGKKANGSDSYNDDFPPLLEAAFAKAFPKKGTTINDYRYINNSYVTSITLSESIRSIGIAAFLNTNLTYVKMKDGITEIPLAAFALSKISNIELPNSITKINTHAFCYSQLSSIVLPENISDISDYVFSETPIVEILFPKSINTLGRNLFYNCDLLRKITYLGKKPSYWYTASTTIVPDNTWSNKDNIYPMITWDTSESIYSGQVPALTWTNNMEGYTVSMTMPQLHADAGTWSDEVPVTFTKDDEIINVQAVCQYTIKPAELTAKVQDASRVYGENDPIYEILYSGFVNGENEEVITTKPTIQSTTNSSSQPGEYTVNISNGKATNYVFKYVSGTLTINKAPLTVTINNASREYGDDNPSFTYAMEGLKNGEEEPAWNNSGPQLTTDAKQNSSVGIYEINIVNAESSNYEVSTKPGTLTITKAPLKVTVNNASKLYGEVNPNFSYSEQGLKLGEEIEWSTGVTYNTLATEKSDVGEYEVMLSGTIDNPNYDMNIEAGKLTVLKRELTFSTPNYTRFYGEDNPEFELSCDGFADGEDISHLTKCPVVATMATKTSDVGTYKLSISGGEAKNYEFVDKCGTLTIERAYQNMAWNQEFENVKKYSQLELTATTTSGLGVTYTLVEGQEAANIYTLGNRTYLDVLSEGTIVLMAQQDGNMNYYPSAKIYKTIEVKGKSVTLTLKDGEQGELRENVNSGEVREIAILPAKNYKVHSVTFNEEDVTDQLTTDGLFTTPVITSNAALYVVFESLTDGVRSISDISPVRVFARQGEIVVTNLEAGQQIYVYDIDGREQALITSNGLSNSIRLKTEQTYIVKAGTKTVKVRL